MRDESCSNVRPCSVSILSPAKCISGDQVIGDIHWFNEFNICPTASLHSTSLPINNLPVDLSQSPTRRQIVQCRRALLSRRDRLPQRASARIIVMCPEDLLLDRIVLVGSGTRVSRGDGWV